MARKERSIPRSNYKFSLDPLHPFERDMDVALKEAIAKERLHFGDDVEQSVVERNAIFELLRIGIETKRRMGILPLGESGTALQTEPVAAVPPAVPTPVSAPASQLPVPSEPPQFDEVGSPRVNGAAVAEAALSAAQNDSQETHDPDAGEQFLEDLMSPDHQSAPIKPALSLLGGLGITSKRGKE
ncbi:hypothetical protein ACM7LV_26815 [Pseudomonas aeruginosa]|uniref:Uncharacterized protein n=1 Tax=Pseudomonas aeruginosa TaxID=287 RepID=A0A9P1R9E5_PSEAI|nr:MULTISPECIES: hypothetical protein [Pseudomonas]KFF32412.1 hypothetical protein G039_0332935 [Pseudomonas aeruginosa VRFPA01]SCZ07393.1 Uncharacterised protein [Acinetobacter baumannii]EKV3606929.1 hypothetical protein [Pseudomonas aeruginosa]EKW6796114.1 hypothetical protein [Pseudomonas aeruginosa]EKX7258175.1 hypothetical protein [Pseudomonas aeruginosa]